MKKSFGYFYVASLSLLLLASTIALPLQSFAEKPEESKNPVVILFKDKVTQKQKDLVTSMGGEITRNYKIINGVAANLSPQSIENLQKNPTVITVDPDIEFFALELDADKRIGANQVWTHSSPSTGNGVKVAVLDTGIDTDNPEFNGRILLCKSEMGPAEPTCEDLHGHGTHAAGIVGSTGIESLSSEHCNSDTDSTCTKGAAPNVSFLIDKVLDKNGSGSLSGIIAGIDWAVANDAKVISMSLGTSPYFDQSADHCDLWYQSMTNAVNNAFAEGVSVIAAAGNAGQNGVGLPACLRNTIAVAAVDDNDKIASFSSVGGAVKDHGISAPGVYIYSTLPGNTYASWSGTSMATPVVAGTAALLLEEDPTLSAYAIKQALFNTACTATTSPECSYVTDTPNITYGHGRVNAIEAYNSIVQNLDPVDNDLDGFTSDVDCDDNNNTIYPNAPEISDGLDNNCDGVIPSTETDDDNDGYSEDGFVGGAFDCDDNNNTIYPNAPELADQLDNDCDGLVDEVPTKFHVGDLNWDASNKKNWRALVEITITELDNTTPVGNVDVVGIFTTPNNEQFSVNCMTDSSGKCTVEKTTRENELNFSVFSLTKTDYETSNTHNDPDDDFVGNDPSVTIVKGSSSVGSIGGGSDGGTDDGSGPSCPPGKAAKNKC